MEWEDILLSLQQFTTTLVSYTMDPGDTLIVPTFNKQFL